MSQPKEKLQAAYAVWESAEVEYQSAIDALKSGSPEYNKDAIETKIDTTIKLKNEFDFLELDFPLPDQD